jgi:hypothetical protein
MFAGLCNDYSAHPQMLTLCFFICPPRPGATRSHACWCAAAETWRSQGREPEALSGLGSLICRSLPGGSSLGGHYRGRAPWGCTCTCTCRGSARGRPCTGQAGRAGPWMGFPSAESPCAWQLLPARQDVGTLDGTHLRRYHRPSRECRRPTAPRLSRRSPASASRRRAGAGCCPCSRPHHSQPDPEPWASRCLPQLRCWRLCKEERSGPQPRPWGRAGPEGPGRGRWPRPRPVLSPRPGPEPALPTASPTILGSGSAGLGLGGESKVPEFRSGGRGRRGRGCSWERPAADRRKARGRAGGAGWLEAWVLHGDSSL